jgi:hypothetical protein
MAHPTLKPGTRVRCTYRNDPNFRHVGTLLADDDPKGWTGSLAFPFGEPSVEDVRAHIASYQARHADLKAYDATRATVAWDFGKVYRESAESLFPAE